MKGRCPLVESHQSGGPDQSGQVSGGMTVGTPNPAGKQVVGIVDSFL
jgi:hypothetical protein